MNQKTREYLRYLSALSLSAGIGGAVPALADDTASPDQDAAASTVVDEGAMAGLPWYYQAWPESTFRQINPPRGVVGAEDVDFAALLAEVEQA